MTITGSDAMKGLLNPPSPEIYSTVTTQPTTDSQALPPNVPANSAALTYDDNSIKTLSSLEHIRTRPGMYIGRLGNGDQQDDGIYVLLKEVIDNSIDEFSSGFGRKIEVTVSDEGEVRVRDYGRGIPLDSVVACVSKINTGGKFIAGEDGKPRAFACSIGLNGVGLKAVNALSERFTVISRRQGQSMTAIFEDGVQKSARKGKTADPDGTEVIFKPSNAVFPGFHFEMRHLRRRMQNYSWLNSGLSLSLNNEKFYSRRGLQDLLEAKMEGEPLYSPFYYRSERLDFTFTHLANMDETYYSFVNGQYTNDGGTHLSAFKEGVLKAVNEISGKTVEASDVRCGIVAAVVVRLQDPIFESQTKNKLGNADIRGWVVNDVKAAIVEAMFKNPEMKAAILDKVNQNENLRKQIMSVKKEAKEQAKKTALKIPKLRDCKFHLCDYDSRRKKEEKDMCLESMLFLTEGDSAASNMISARNPDYQAVFPLRGKPYNCQGKRRETVYKNEELYFIMQALGIEESLDNLRYGKVIIASDADVDGFHIRLLLMTFFLTFFQSLVLSDHLYILETPLFRERNKKQNIYCYNEREKQQAELELGRGCEVTRFKGLGEISPHEFGQFVGSGIKLLPVTVDKIKNVDKMLKFYMGDNTPERKSFIMNNLR